MPALSSAVPNSRKHAEFFAKKIRRRGILLLNR